MMDSKLPQIRTDVSVRSNTDSGTPSASESLGVTSMMSMDSGFSDHASIKQTDSGSVVSTPMVQPPLSPDRSVQHSLASSPGSVSRYQEVPPNISPVPTVSVGSYQDNTPGGFGVPSLDSNDTGVLLGLQQLERQQEENERRRHAGAVQAQRQPHQQRQRQHEQRRLDMFDADDDENTEPASSLAGTAENPAGGYPAEDDNIINATSTFGRLIQNTRRRLSTGDMDDRERAGSAEEGNMLEGALIYGYLKKLGRNGKWQTRWFETDGECLTYYKSSKRNKLLATLDLAKVGSIVVNFEDPKGCSFTINISERPYHLQADSKAACKDWVITLNRVKEARMQEGNVKLMMPKKSNAATDFFGTKQQVPEYTPRVVVVANRERTRALDEENMQSWEQVVNWDDPANDGGKQQQQRFNNQSPYYTVAPSSSRLARWQKPRTSLSRMANKVLRWARSLRKYRCNDIENQVILDPHLHPPGHDDKPRKSTSPVGMELRNKTEAGHGAWIGKETSAAELAGPSVSAKDVIHNLATDSIAHSSSAVSQDEEGETRELS